MTLKELSDIQLKCKKSEEILKFQRELESRIKVINAEISTFQGDKNLMIREKSNPIVPIDIFPYRPDDEEIIQLGEFIQNLYTKKLDNLKIRFEAI